MACDPKRILSDLEIAGKVTLDNGKNAVITVNSNLADANGNVVVDTGSGIPNVPAKQAMTVRYDLQTGIAAFAGDPATVTMSFSALADSAFGFIDIRESGGGLDDLIINSGSETATAIRLWGGGGTPSFTQQATFRLRITASTTPNVGTLQGNLANWATQFNTIPVVGQTALAVGNLAINRNYTAAQVGDTIVFTRNVGGIFSKTWTIFNQGNWTNSSNVIDDTDGSAPTPATDDEWVVDAGTANAYINTFNNTPDLLTKVALFLGTEGTMVPNSDPLLVHTPYTTNGVTYYFFPNRDSGRGQWSDNTNPSATGAVVWNLIG